MLLDFGIAKLLQPTTPGARDANSPASGGRRMTLEYAAPEQISGAPISTATDVYALGVLLYELLRQRPFRHDTARRPEQAILTGEPADRRAAIGASPAAAQPGRDLDTIVLQGLEEDAGRSAMPA